LGCSSGDYLSDCIAIEEEHDDLVEEGFDFGIPFWQNFTVVRPLTQGFLPPPYANGNYELEFSFCKTINLRWLDMGLGWNFGQLLHFVEKTVKIPPPPHDYLALLQFVQVYDNGDIGPPCSFPRSSIVNIYCGIDKANCTGINGSIGSQCIAGDTTNPGFCLCGIVPNNSPCDGFTLNILSNNCSKGYAIKIYSPTALPILPHDFFGIIFGTIMGIICLMFMGGICYNRSVLNKKGLRAVPFYDEITCQKELQSYTLPISSSSSTTYGAIDQNT